MKVELHIERLVLEGFRSADRRTVGTALERELGRLVGERGLPESLQAAATVVHLDGGRVDLVPGRGAGASGRSIARGVYRGMKK